MGAHRVRKALLASLQDYADALTDLVRVLIEDPRSICAGCPLGQWYGSRKVMAMRLENAGRVYGVLVVSVPGEVDVEDLDLLELLAAYVASALRVAQLLSALRESEARFRRLAENAQDIIFRYRLKPTPGFEYVSPAVTRISGYTPEGTLCGP
jgi:PAS domain-containing protein